MTVTIQPSDYLLAHQRARSGGFRVISVIAGSPSKARAVFRTWARSLSFIPDVVTAPACEYELAKRALSYASPGAALELIPSPGQLIQAVTTAVRLADEQLDRPIAVMSDISPVEVAVKNLSIDVSLQHAVVGGLVPLVAGVVERVELLTSRPKIPQGYRSNHEYVLHTLIQHDRAIKAQFLANKGVTGASRKQYEIDLWCEKLRLAVEIDGAQHFTVKQRQMDQQRDADLAAAGIKTQRILASAVMADPTRALMFVRQTVDLRLKEISR